MFRKLLYKYLQDPILFSVGVFVALFWFGAIRNQLSPYYNALIEQTGGGWPLVSEMYHNAELTIILMFQ
ncbi:hypothetical protein [Vibrio sp. TBV020]|uniref:hypothetical protein n=1 Tax=Vibrio sp. TBV020 TaxID=3137398 RepID=UPI0038CD1DA3